MREVGSPATCGMSGQAGAVGMSVFAVAIAPAKHQATLQEEAGAEQSDDGGRSPGSP